MNNEQKITNLENHLALLRAEFDSLKSSNTIPLQIDQSFRGRFSFGSTIGTSSKSATSENKVVDEAGASTYSVLGIPDGFVTTTLANGTIIYLAYWT